MWSKKANFDTIGCHIFVGGEFTQEAIFTRKAIFRQEKKFYAEGDLYWESDIYAEGDICKHRLQHADLYQN